MLHNYLKITFRNLAKHRGFTAINILGLTLGIVSILIITLIIRYELSFDQFHPNKSSIYRVVRHTSNASGQSTHPNTAYPLAQALRTQLPSLSDQVAQIHYHGEDQLEAGGKKDFEQDIIFADPQFFNLFEYPIVSGNPTQDLKKPGVVYITSTIAKKYFGDQPPIGQTFRLAGKEDLEVVGILKDHSLNSHLQMNIVVSYATLTSDFIGSFSIEEWGVNMSGYTYANLSQPSDVKSLQSALSALAHAHYDESDGEQTVFRLQHLEDIHFDQRYANSNFPAIDKYYIFILSCIGGFILIIACVNFVNMSTALAARRAKEVGMRRALGARKSELVVQFMGEAFVIVLISLALGLAIIEHIAPVVSTFLDKALKLNLFSNWSMAAGIFLLLILVTVAAGLYPSVILAGYSPVRVLKTRLNNSQSQGGSSLRISLITFQFVISQALIIATIVIAAQTDYFSNKPLGFDKDMIITLPLMGQDSLKNQTLKHRILQHPDINSLSYAVGAPTSINNLKTTFAVEESPDEEQYDISLKVADIDYMQTYGLTLIKGRWFDENDSYVKQEGVSVKKAFIVNETAVHQMGYSIDEVLGKYITIDINAIKAPVIGVVRDFHMRSFHNKIEPMVILDIPQLYYQAGIRVSGNNLPETIDFLKSSWEQAYPEHIFQYDFLDEKIASNYEKEQRIFTMFQVFAGVSVFICCIGLFGLISFIITSKTKEVGVRKVLGASPNSILLLFSKNFLTVLITAFVIATPVVWYALKNWLDSFAYHIDLHVGYFATGLICTVFITICSISFQSFKAATANPIEALQDE